jgi:predicted enzyme related to lactoylglutathione lyase
MPAQLNLVVRDLGASLAFYRLFGWQARVTGPHATISFPDGLDVDFDQHEFARQWNRGTPPVEGGSVVITLRCGTREEVDAVYTRVLDAGYGSRQVPYDAFWGSRFAVVADPDGYQIGLMSPASDEHRSGPPTDAPTA